MTIWSLHVDESGDFSDDATERIWVAGVLSRHANTPSLERALRRGLRAAAPHVPWPLHSTLLLRPVCHAIWWHAAGEPEPAPGGARGIIDCARADAPGALDACLEALAARREPRRRDLIDVERAVRRDPALAKLRAYTHDRIEAVAGALRGASRSGGAPEVFAVLCSEGEPGATLRDPSASGLSRLDRYLQCLAGLLERARDAIAAAEPGDAHRVDVTLATRDVLHPLLGEQAPLSRDGFAVVCEALSVSESDVTFTCAGLRRYDQDASALLVAADLLANRCFRDVRGGVSLRDVRVRLLDHVGLDLHTHARPDLPLLVAMGEAREVVMSLASDAPISPASLTRSHRWARDQATAWNNANPNAKDRS